MRATRLESVLRRLVLTPPYLRLGYVLVDASMIILLSQAIMQILISLQQNIAVLLSSILLPMDAIVLAIVGVLLLAIGILGTPELDFVFGWGVPFNGPSCLYNLGKGCSGSSLSSRFCEFCPSERREHRPLTHIFSLIVALVFGIGLLIGSQILSCSFWN